jgi:hypothetical protein
MLAAPVSRIRVCDACRLAAEQLRSRSRPCLTTGPSVSGAPHVSFFEVGWKTTANPPTCSFRGYFTSHTDLKAQLIFLLFRRISGPTGRIPDGTPFGEACPTRPGYRAGPAQRDGNPPDPPSPPPGDPRPTRGAGEGGSGGGGRGGNTYSPNPAGGGG